MHICPHPRCQSQPAEKSGSAFLDHLADIHHIRFEQAKRQRALKVTAISRESTHANPKEFSFVHVDSEQYAKASPSDGRIHQDKYASTATTAASSPQILDADEDMTMVVQDDQDSYPVPDDVDGHDEDDRAVAGPGSRADVKKGELVVKAPTPQKTKILIIVPPVPDSWKRGDIPCIDALDDDTDMTTVVIERKSGAPRQRPRGRPRGSRNLKTLRRERRMATLAKAHSPYSKSTPT